MKPVPFALALVGTLAGTALAGTAAVFMATRAQGRQHAWSWRVHLVDGFRAWAVEIVEPGREWERVATTPRAYGRDYAIATAKATIDALRG